MSKSEDEEDMEFSPVDVLDSSTPPEQRLWQAVMVQALDDLM